MKSIIFVLLVLSFYGCDFFSPEKANERIATGIQAVESKMTTDYAKAKDTFNLAYQKALQATSDSLITKKLQNVYSVLMETVNYMDSLKTEMNKLDNSDVNNVGLIKEIFLTNGIGDSLFDKLKLSYSLAEDVARTAEKKSAIRNSRTNILNEQDIDQRKNQYFGLNGPEGIEWMLYGFETELLKVGLESLDGYYQNK